MGVLDRFRNAFGSSQKLMPDLAPEPHIHVLSDTPAVDISQLVHRLRATGNDRATAVEASVWALRCVQYRIAEIMNADWELLSADGEKVEDHPFMNAYNYLWLRRQQDLFARWLLMRIVHGDTYIYKSYIGDTATPGGLFVLNSLNVELEFQMGAIRYRYRSSEMSEKEYTEEQLFHDRTMNVRSDVRGKSQLDAVLADVDITRFNRMTVQSYLLGDMKPGGLVTPHPNAEALTEESAETLLEKWRAQGAGPRGGWKLKIMTVPLQYQPFGNTPPTGEIGEDARLAICVGLGVDPAVFGAASIKDPLGANTTLREKRAAVARNTVRSDMKHLERFVNKVILPWISPNDGVKFAFDYSKIDALIEQDTERADLELRIFEAGGMSYNEWRRKLHLPEVATDFFNVPPGRRYVHVDNLAEMVALEQFNMGLSLPSDSSPQIAAALRRLAQAVPEASNDADGADIDEGDAEGEGEDGTKSADSALLRELRNWERIALRDPHRALKFAERAIPATVANRIRSELGAVNYTDPGVVAALFGTCREFLGAHKIFDDVLYQGRSVTITEADVDDAHADVAHIPNLHALLNAGVQELQDDEIEA